MHDYLLNELCSYSKNSTIGTREKFLILVKSSMDFTLFFTRVKVSHLHECVATS